jgi:hypothetical protein
MLFSTRLSVVLAAMALSISACAQHEARPANTVHVASAAKLTPGDIPQPQACSGLDASELRGGFFRDNRKATSVEQLYGEHRIGARNVVSRPIGARIVVAAEPSMTAPWLERVAHCHTELYKASGQTAPDEPLSVPGATVAVRAVHAGYAIDVTSDSWDGAREIYSRAQAATARQ